MPAAARRQGGCRDRDQDIIEAILRGDWVCTLLRKHTDREITFDTVKLRTTTTYTRALYHVLRKDPAAER